MTDIKAVREDMNELELSFMSSPRRDLPARVRDHVSRAWPRYASLLLLPIIVLVWQWITAAELIHVILLPEFTSVLEEFIELVTRRDFPRHLFRTVASIFSGFGIGSLLGISSGLVLASFPLLRRAYFPLVSGFAALPKVVLAPLAIIWLGFGMSSKVAIAVVAAFFPVFLATLTGLALVSQSELAIMRSLRASKWQVFTKLRLPSALPAIFGGLKLAMATATVTAIVAEFVGTDAGLGYLTVVFKNGFNIAGMFALVFVFMFMGSASFLLLEGLERKIVFWRK